MECGVKGLYLKLGWDLVTAAFVPTFVQSFHPSTITINAGQAHIQNAEHKTSGSDIMFKLERLVRKKLLFQLFDCASTKRMPAHIKEKHKAVAVALAKIVCEEIIKSSVITLPSSFPSAGHPSRMPVPACFANLTTFIHHVDIDLAIQVGVTPHDYVYPAEICTLRNGILKIKDYLPFLKTIKAIVKEVTPYGSTKAYVARGRTGSSMLMRITVPGSFEGQEETTLEEEVQVSKR